MKICLDAGHSLVTAGKRTPNGIHEWTLNNAVCNFIAEYLKPYGVEIFRTDDTTGNTDLSLPERVNRCNSFNPRVFISIHHNAFRGIFENVTGIEVFSHTQGTAEDRKLAGIIAPKLSANTGLFNRGAKTKYLGVLNCKATAVLCEGGFMDGIVDNAIICSEKGQKAYAKAVGDSLIECFGLVKTPIFIPTVKPTVKPIEKTRYNIGKYITLESMRVRTGAGTKFRHKFKWQLTPDGQKNCIFGIYGTYKAGTDFYASEIINNGYSVWAKTPSGFICIKDKNNIYCKKI